MRLKRPMRPQAGAGMGPVSRYLGQSSVTPAGKPGLGPLRQDYPDLARILGDRLDSDMQMIRAQEQFPAHSGLPKPCNARRCWAARTMHQGRKEVIAE